jgi:hypothetical protein
MKCRDVRLAYSNNLKSNASIHQLAELHKQLDKDLWWQRNGRSVVVRDGVADLLCWRPAMLFLFLLFRRASRPRLLSVGFAPAISFLDAFKNTVLGNKSIRGLSCSISSSGSVCEQSTYAR